MNLSVGDRVLIYRKPTKNDKTNIFWNHDMDMLVGTEGTVGSILTRYIGVTLNEDIWTFPIQCVKKVED